MPRSPPLRGEAVGVLGPHRVVGQQCCQYRGPGVSRGQGAPRGVSAQEASSTVVQFPARFLQHSCVASRRAGKLQET
eukprot:14127726-Alexandrium_andersonii.AAC.1